MKRLHPLIAPTKLEISSMEIRPWSDNEVSNILEYAKSTSQWKPFIDTFSKKFGDDKTKEIVKYILNTWIPRPFYEYWKYVSDLANEDGVSISTSKSVKRVTEYVTSADTVEDVKKRIDTVIKKYAGISRYKLPLVSILEDKVPILKCLPYPPQRIGIPRTLTVESSEDVLNFKGIDVAEIIAKDKMPIGPLLEDDEPARIEMRFTPEPGKKSASLGVVWMLFELRYCWWVERIWLPFAVGTELIEPSEYREAVFRFQVVPDRIRTFAYRIQPIALNVKKIQVRRIA